MKLRLVTRNLVDSAPMQSGVNGDLGAVAQLLASEACNRGEEVWNERQMIVVNHSLVIWRNSLHVKRMCHVPQMWIAFFTRGVNGVLAVALAMEPNAAREASKSTAEAMAHIVKPTLRRHHRAIRARMNLLQPVVAMETTLRNHVLSASGPLGEFARRLVEQVNISGLGQSFRKLRVEDLFARMHFKKHSSAFLETARQYLRLLIAYGASGVSGVHAPSARVNDPDSEPQVWQGMVESHALLVLAERPLAVR